MVAMEMATEAANIAVRAVTVRAENPLFQSMGVEETAVAEEPVAVATTTEWAKQATKRAAEAQAH